jgi:hypothetical protein
VTDLKYPTTRDTVEKFLAGGCEVWVGCHRFRATRRKPSGKHVVAAKRGWAPMGRSGINYLSVTAWPKRPSAAAISTAQSSPTTAIQAIGLCISRSAIRTPRTRLLETTKKRAPAWAFRHTSRAATDPALARRLGISGSDHLFVSYEKYVKTTHSHRARAVKPKGFSRGALIELDLAAAARHAPHAGRLAAIIIERPHQQHAKLVAAKIQLILANSLQLRHKRNARQLVLLPSAAIRYDPLGRTKLFRRSAKRAMDSARVRVY